jgi:hypothetical protein
MDRGQKVTPQIWIHDRIEWQPPTQPSSPNKDRGNRNPISDLQNSTGLLFLHFLLGQLAGLLYELLLRDARPDEKMKQCLN